MTCELFFFIFSIKKKMKIEHRFSFFIFQLSEKMNDPNIHALKRNVKNYAKYSIWVLLKIKI